MSEHVGIWIDHAKAVIVSGSADHLTTRTLESTAEPHPHFGGSQEGGGEKKYEERHALQLDRYYDAVIDTIGRPDALLIIGPGEAKTQLEARLRRHEALSASVVTVESADRLTDPQIVAKVKEHFGFPK